MQREILRLSEQRTQESLTEIQRLRSSITDLLTHSGFQYLIDRST
jgi:hypothetical protein